MSPTSSQMQKVEPSRIVSCGKSAPDDADGARLGQGFDDELVDVDMEGPGEREEDAVGDVLGAERVDALVRLLRLLLVAAEANAGEVRLDEAGIDSREPDRATQQVLTERVGEAAHGVLGRDIDRSVLVGLAARDRAHVDDVPTVADMRQAEAGQPEQSVDVGFQRRVLIFFGRLPKGIAPEAEAGVVDEDVQAAELADRCLDESLAALSVGDVELELDLRVELLDAAGAARGPRPPPREGGRPPRAPGPPGAPGTC